MEQEPKPILMKISGELRFSKDGRWFHEETEFTHEKVRDYFSKHFHFSPALERYVVEAEGKCVPVTVEDTAVVVKSLRTNEAPWTAILGDGSEEAFRPDTISVTSEPVYYCTAQNGERARLLGTSVQALIPFVNERPDGTFALKVGSEEFRIEVRTRCQS